MKAEVLQLGEGDGEDEDDGGPLWSELPAELPQPDSPARAIKSPAAQIKRVRPSSRGRLGAFLAPNLTNSIADLPAVF